MSGRTSRASAISTPGVLTPQALGDVLQLLRRDPELPLWAGGTWWMDRGEHRSRLVALHGVSELKRVVRSDIRVDVGAAIPIARLREVGSHFLPEPLVAAMDRMGPPPVRNLATIGGAICVPEGTLPIAVVLQLLEAKVELRRFGHSRWVPISKIDLAPGELLTRVRIPLRTRTNWMLHQFGFAYPITSSSLTVVATASVEKDNLEEFHAAFLIDGIHLIRLREAESEIVGRSLPLTERDLRTVLGALENEPLYGKHLDNLGRWRASSTLRQFLRTL